MSVSVIEEPSRLDIAAIQVIVTPLVEDAIFFHSGVMIQDWRRVFIQRFDLNYVSICYASGRRL